MKKTMDPNPKKFPILSFVLSRFHPNPNPPSAFDIEQPPTPQRASSSSAPSPRHASDVELMERMPRLNQPDLLASMAGAVADVAHTRSVLSTLGDRPDHEAVDDARSALARVDADLSSQLEDLFRAPRPDEVDTAQWRAELAGKEKELRGKAEREKFAYKAVVQLDEMHGAYEKLLRDAEERLVHIYGASATVASASDSREKDKKEGDFGDHVDEEIVRILQGSAENTERVDLSGRQLRFLPEVFGKFANLLVLDLSNNQLEAIPDSIAGLEHLEELNASSNLLVSLPDSIGLLHSLKILNVSGNKLKTLPDSISSCRSLAELDVSFNELAYLPTNIGYELLNLQKLVVNLNKLRSLPTSVCEMRSLQHLDAHFNELHGLPSAFGKLTNLELLNLSSNFSDMKVLPETFGDLINLKELDLSNNQIHALPDTFGQLENLVKLNLDQNPIIIPAVNVVGEGAAAVKEFMAKRLLDILEEQKNRELQAEAESRAGWLTRSTSWLKNYVSGVSGTVSEYLGPGNRDPYLDQQL